MVQTLQLSAPSGARLRLDLPDEPAVSAVGAYVRFAGSNFGQAFQTGVRGYHAEVCRDLVPATVQDRFVLQGREVAVAVSADKHATVAGWLGPHHEAVLFLTGSTGGRASLLRVFEQFVFDDAPDGLRITPANLSGIDVEIESICVLVAKGRRIVVPAANRARGMAPRHAGARTRHGEVWRVSKQPEEAVRDSERARDYLYLLGTSRGLAEISFDDGVKESDSTLLTWIDNVDLRWE